MSVVDERQITSSRDTQDARQQRTVEQAIDAALSQSGYYAIKQIRYKFDRGALTLCGHVPNYYMKQMAQAAVSRVSGIVLIDNQLEFT